MRVLHVFKTYLPDSFTGVERVIHEIADGLSSKGVSSCVLSLSKNPIGGVYKVSRHWGIQVKENINASSTGISYKLPRVLRDCTKQFDIVHYHFPWPMMDVAHFFSNHKKPSVLTYHSDIVKQKKLLKIYKPLMNIFLSEMNRIVATSPNYVETSPILSRYNDKVEVIPIGISDASPPGNHVIERWRSMVGEGFFLFVGQLRYYKGLRYLIEAARLSDVTVVIAGSGELPKDLSANVPANVRLIGRISDEDKDALLFLARGFVLPSHLRSEAFGVSLLEAARAGKPLISCEIGTGTTYVNVSGSTGIAVPPADPIALAAALNKISNPRLAMRMGNSARDRYLKHFTSEAMCNSYLDLYQSVLQQSME